MTTVLSEEEWLEAQKRPCGDCQECCVALPVTATKPPILKPSKTRCDYQCEKGCSIYDDRPSPCRSYLCQWAAGWGKPEWRPDKWGLIVEANASNMAIMIVEVREGALDTDEVQSILPLLQGQAPVLITRYNGDQLIYVESEEEFMRLAEVHKDLLREHEELIGQVKAAMQSDCMKEGTT